MGVDLSRVMVDKAVQGSQGNPRLSFQVGDAEALPFADASFDAVVNTLSFHHYPHPEKAAREFARVVRPGGLVIVVDPLLHGAGLTGGLLTAHRDRRFYGRQARRQHQL